MTNRVCIASQRGGVGKTSLAVNLARSLVEVGQSVLLVDTDPQASATWWMGQDVSRALAEALADGSPLEPGVIPTTSGVALVPSSGLVLSKAARVLAGEPGAELALRKALDGLPEKWDWTIIDTPPDIGGLLSVGALASSRSILVPVTPDPGGLGGIAGVLHVAGQVRDRLNPELGEELFLLSRVDHARVAWEAEEELRKLFGKRVLKDTIPQRVAVREAWGARKALLDYDRRSDASEAFLSVAQDVLARHTNRTGRRV